MLIQTQKERKIEQLVAKMQFKKNDEKANPESIDPAEIIYAEQVWVYNTPRLESWGITKVLDLRGMNRPKHRIDGKGHQQRI